jgi:hypothetical protein
MADDAVLDAEQRALRIRAQSCHPFGMEGLDRLGIDIDQDPRAFAKFLELKNLMQMRSAALPRRKSWSKPTAIAGSRSPGRVARFSGLS